MSLFAVYQLEELQELEAIGPLTAWASVKPCQLYADHGSAVPVITQGHHRRPEYLQRRKYGGEVRYHELTWLCGTCHDNTHAELYYRMGERRWPGPVPLRSVALAKYALAWYLDPAA